MRDYGYLAPVFLCIYSFLQENIISNQPNVSDIFSSKFATYETKIEQRGRETHIITTKSTKIAEEMVERSTIDSPVCLEFTTSNKEPTNF